MRDELQELQIRIEDTARQLDFARAGGNDERIAKLENELSAMMRDLESATGSPVVRRRQSFNEAIERALDAEMSGDGRAISAAWAEVPDPPRPY
jgi:hypothetical protein